MGLGAFHVDFNDFAFPTRLSYHHDDTAPLKDTASLRAYNIVNTLDSYNKHDSPYAFRT